MGKNHIKRIAAPKSWDIKRKTYKFIARPMPGPHSVKSALTLNFLLRNVLEYAKTTKEIKMILTNKSILVDKTVRNDYKFPIDSKESNMKLLKVINKSIVKKGKIQLTFHDGRNILLDKFEGKVGDTA